MNKEIFTELYNSVIEYARRNHAGEIDTAYDYFWEDESPEDFMGGVAIELAFINFEDFLVCDYRPREGKGIIARYMEDEKPGGEETKALEVMRDSIVSLYEVLSTEETGVIRLNDLVLDIEASINPGNLSGLASGDLFAARILDMDGGGIMGKCAYPFGNRRKEDVLRFLDRHIERYGKHSENGVDLRVMLKENAYLFNNIWLSCLSLK